MGKTLSQKEVEERISKNFKQKVSPISTYVNRRNPIRLRCEDCGYEWEVGASSALYSDHKHECPNCKAEEHKDIQLACAYCGAPVYRRPSDIKKNKSGLFYCSKTCGNLHKNQIRKESAEWENSKSYRLRAFEKYEHKCAVCGWDEDERILEVHHIDENRENNLVDNLIILCPTCHRKITLKYYKLTEDHKLIEQ